MTRAKPAGLDILLRIYYENDEIGTSEIQQIFPSVGSTTICKMKREVSALMAERGIKTRRAYTIDTETAYEYWGFDAEDMERRRQKLIKLKLAGVAD